MLLTFPGVGSPGANIWHIRTIADPLDAGELSQANSLVGYIRTFYSALVGFLPATTTVNLGTVTEEETQREITPTMATVTGSGTGSAPQALAVVVTWKTSIAARRGRGRTFLGPLATTLMQSDGTPNDASLVSIRTAAGALVTSSTSFGNGAIGVYGYQNAKVSGKENLRDPNDPRVFRDFTGYAVRDQFGVLRSRRD